MSDLSLKSKDPADRKSSKRDAKKREIADSALEALKELGYANTSLRDIAAKSDMSLGMLHYYFKDRAELIIFCVQVYKRDYARNLAEVLHKADERDDVIADLAEALANSIIDDAMIHRLWYDIRTQAMFDEVFRPVIAEIETLLIDLVGQVLLKLGKSNPGDIAMQYALLDGAFRYLMYEQFGQNARSREELQHVVKIVLKGFVR